MLNSKDTRDNAVNLLEEADSIVSICPLQEEVAEYVGPELAPIAAVASLQLPLDHPSEEIGS